VPRIRTIKPEFWTSLTVASLPLPVRLTFIGLWNFSDDEGRSVFEPRLLKAAVWPLDDEITAADVGSHLAALARVGLVSMYEVEGRQYVQVSSWTEHQKVEKKRTSALPPPPRGLPDGSPPPPRGLPDGSPPPPRLLPDSSPREGKGKEGKGEERNGGGGEGAPTPRRATDSEVYREVRSSLPPEYHDTLDGHLRASQNPPALLAELKAIASGMHPPAYDWPVIGRALSDLAVAGGRVTPKALRAFCRGIVEERSPGPRGDDDGLSEYQRAALKLQAEADRASKPA
jgi:hypothetical protein